MGSKWLIFCPPNGHLKITNELSKLHDDAQKVFCNQQFKKKEKNNMMYDYREGFKTENIKHLGWEVELIYFLFWNIPLQSFKSQI